MLATVTVWSTADIDSISGDGNAVEACNKFLTERGDKSISIIMYVKVEH